MVIIWWITGNNNLVGGFSLPFWKMMELVSEFVSWDDDMTPIWWKVIKFHGSKPPTSYKLYNHHIPIVVGLYPMENHY